MRRPNSRRNRKRFPTINSVARTGGGGPWAKELDKEPSVENEREKPRQRPEPAQRVTSSRWAWIGIIWGIISMGSSISNGDKVTKWREATKDSKKLQINSGGKDLESQMGQARSWIRGTGEPAYNNDPA